MPTNQEKIRLSESISNAKNWKKWGPYLADRQWGTVREDYSADGNAWDTTTHDAARSRAYRWGEEGIGGISDDKQLLCFALAFWNGKDPILKERYFGLSGHEGNHGEDVKENYYYLDSTTTNSYMKMLYKYPQTECPYLRLIEENRNRNRQQTEFELDNSGIFDKNKYFDIFIEYAKKDETDILIKITTHNRANEAASIDVVPQIWFRNTWSLGYDVHKPLMGYRDEYSLVINHKKLGLYHL